MLPTLHATPSSHTMVDVANQDFPPQASETWLELSQFLTEEGALADPTGLTHGFDLEDQTGLHGLQPPPPQPDHSAAALPRPLSPNPSWFESSYTIVSHSDVTRIELFPDGLSRDTPVPPGSSHLPVPVLVTNSEMAATCPHQEPWSPAASTVSRGSPLPFPSPAPTPEAALVQEDGALPNIQQADQSIFSKGIKAELRQKIQSKRRSTGLNSLVAEYKETKPEVLTPADVDRRERRRLSNRKAATKCREKKKRAVENLHEDLKREQTINHKLRVEIEKVKLEKEMLEKEWREHMSICPQR